MNIMRYRVLRAIQSLRVANDISPSYDEIAEEVGLQNRASVHYHVKKLTKEGLLLARVRAKARTLLLSDAGKEFLAKIILDK